MGPGVLLNGCGRSMRVTCTAKISASMGPDMNSSLWELLPSYSHPRNTWSNYQPHLVRFSLTTNVANQCGWCST